MVAPCLEIPTTDRLGTAGYNSGDYYDRFNGTSSATPHVAGLAALILSARPDLSNEEVREIIETTCDKIRPGNYTYGYAGHKPNGQWNEEVGYGLINVERAVLVACDYGAKQSDMSCKQPGVNIKETEEVCLGPAAPPWKDTDTCLWWYENRYITEPQNVCQIRMVFSHCLRLLGRQQGNMLYSTTLLPGETLRLYTYDRYRRVRSESERLSIHASLRQTVSSLWESRITQRESLYAQLLNTTRTESDSSFSIGGFLLPFGGDVNNSSSSSTSLLIAASTQTVSSEFQQTLQIASQQIEAERTIIVSTYEDEENREVTTRAITNENQCHSVTYYIRRVNECYSMNTRLNEISWRTYEPAFKGYGPWRSIDDLEGADDKLCRYLQKKLRQLQKIGDEVAATRTISIPTDGMEVETELARCSSCDPEREAQIHIDLQRAHSEARRLCYEIDLLDLEVKRRRRLLEEGKLDPYEPPIETETMIEFKPVRIMRDAPTVEIAVPEEKHNGPRRRKLSNSRTDSAVKVGTGG